jgi:hypothetical protein
MIWVIFPKVVAVGLAEFVKRDAAAIDEGKKEVVAGVLQDGLGKARLGVLEVFVYSDNLAAKVAFVALASGAAEVGRALELHHGFRRRVPVGVEVTVGGCFACELVAGREARERSILRQGSGRGLVVRRHLRCSDRSILGGNGGGRRRVGKEVYLGAEAVAVCCRCYRCVLLALLRSGVERGGVIVSIFVIGAESVQVAVAFVPGACIVPRAGVRHGGICLWG